MIGLPYTALRITFDLSTAPGINPYSARALHGTLSPIEAGQGLDKLARNVNGGLIDISAPQFRKYRLEVRGNDQAPPALDGLWVGMLVNVNSLVELGYQTADGTPTRSPVAGSVRVEGDFTYYCPQFRMRVVHWHQERDEWDAAVAWSLELEED
jgi:hypothetical protein